MNFDDTMGTSHMDDPAKRCGRLLLAWFVAVEVLKVTVNRMESRLGEAETQWFTVHDDRKHFLSDGCVIERFGELCDAENKVIVEHLCAAREARNYIAHHLGPELAEYLNENREEILSRTPLEKLVNGDWAEPLAEEAMRLIDSCERDIKKACDSVKSFVQQFLLNKN